MHCGGGRHQHAPVAAAAAAAAAAVVVVVWWHVFTVQYVLIGCSDALIVANNQRNAQKTMLRPLCNCEGWFPCSARSFASEIHDFIWSHTAFVSNLV